MASFNFEIFNVVGTLSEGKGGMKKQLTCTAWGRYKPKFDIREWDEDYNNMKKGVTLTLEEAIALRDILNESNLEEIMEDALAEKEANK